MSLKQFLLSLFVILAFAGGSVSAATYVTANDGAWGAQATWGGTYTSHFAALGTPPTPPNWFTCGCNDTIYIRHNVTMDYDIFIRPTDILVIDTMGSLNAGSHGGFYNLSPGQPGFLLGGVQSGTYVYGQMNVGFVRNTALMTLASTGLINVTLGAGGGSGFLENFGDFFITGDLIVSGGGNIEHNAGDIWIFSGGNVEIDGGDFNNRSVIRNLFPDSCIRLLGGSFNNLLGAAVIGAGGVSADLFVDNTANPQTAWQGVSWCAGIAGRNVPVSLEDCTTPCALPLPVSLVTFDVQADDNGGVVLEWETEWELNARDFTVQKSQDNEIFLDLATVPASGTTYEPTTYGHFDESPFGVTYYRLKQTDLNGDFTYSEIKTVVLEGLELGFDFWPNPAEDVLGVNVRPNSEELPVLIIYDNFGKEMKRVELPELQKDVDVSDLAPGMYILNLVAGQEMTSAKLLIK